MATKCWRCDREKELVHDPMSHPLDRIGVCALCAAIRRSVAAIYMQQRANLIPVQIEGDVVTE